MMNKKRNYYLYIILFFIQWFTINQSLAACGSLSTNGNIHIPSFEKEVSADAGGFYQYELTDWSSIGTVTIIKNQGETDCNSYDSTHNGWRLYGQTNQSPLSSIMLDGLPHNIFEASVIGDNGSVNNIMYVVKAKATNGNLVYLNDVFNFNDSYSIWSFTHASGIYYGATQIHYQIKFFMKQGTTLPAGTYTVNPPAGGIGEVFLTNTQSSTSKVISRIMDHSAFQFTIKNSTCAVDAGDANQVVNLPPTHISEFQNIGSNTGLTPFHIKVDCPQGVALYATMTDANLPTNTSSILTLNQNSTAEGVGVRIYANDTNNVVSFGPQSSVAGNLNQFYIGGGESTLATNYNIPFYAEYVQTESQVKAGRLSAQAIITFSYQ